MKRFVCIHGHFYQPPRENPWLEAIEVQDSARPYHDWNERITAECYAPNAATRILGPDARIVRIVNNYEHISFNFGPTLLSWLETHDPPTYAAVLAADAASVRDHGGHGNAIAQVYNHVILPLASARDKETQIMWGIRDFKARFRRKPEGMWLAETAADVPTLRALADQGIKFTVLSPFQAKRVRRMSHQHDGVTGKESEWLDVPPGSVDGTRPYLVPLGKGKSIVVFFYDGNLSRAVAFEQLLADGRHLADRLRSAFSESSHAQLVHMATDGETYGHHFRHGDMALAFALKLLLEDDTLKVTNYGEFLAHHPPTCEAEIHEPSSWSCFHGVERWNSDCGCNSGVEFRQGWRGPLRKSLNWLRSRLDSLYEEMAGRYLTHVWEARNDYIDVILDRGRVDAFFKKHKRHALDAAERVKVLKLMELQRNAQLMYTSCGWFFDDISGIESAQILKYAARALDLASELGIDLDRQFRERLVEAPSNFDMFKDGAGVWDREVRPAAVGADRIIAHMAMSNLVEEPDRNQIYCFQVAPQDYGRQSFGHTSLAFGQVRITSDITRDTCEATFAVLHFGGHDFQCCVGRMDPAGYAELQESLTAAFATRSSTEAVRAMDRLFGVHHYTIKDLLTEGRRRILLATLRDTLSRYESSFRDLFIQCSPMMDYLVEVGVPPPAEFMAASQYVLRNDIEKALNSSFVDIPSELMTAIRLSERWGVPLDHDRLEVLVRRDLEAAARTLLPEVNPEALVRLDRLLDLMGLLRVDVRLWDTQNIVHAALLRHTSWLQSNRDRPDGQHFAAVLHRLRLNVDAVLAAEMVSHPVKIG